VFCCGGCWAGKLVENPLNLTKSKRPRIGFKAGVICGEWYCTGLFGPVFAMFPPPEVIDRFNSDGYDATESEILPWSWLRLCAYKVGTIVARKYSIAQ
jgi:hypothetical protein